MESQCFDPNIDLHYKTYTVNIPLSQSLYDNLAPLRNALLCRFGDSVHIPKKEESHITVLSCTPFQLTDGPEVRTLFFEKLQEHYASAISRIVRHTSFAPLHFDTLKVTGEGIILLANNTEEVNTLRSEIQSSIPYAPGIKPAPRIVHSTIAAFKQPVPKKVVESIVKQYSADFYESISEIRIIAEYKARMQKVQVVRGWVL